ncbi:MAG: hypothetical protein HZB46_13295 [Solirubrobacterales bacterium]|nr:hypothetical protein [Solirubrobacterales bacterium]
MILHRAGNRLAQPLLASAVIALLVRMPSLRDPLSVDPSVYLTISDGLLHGAAPYRDIFDHKGPLTYLLFVPVAPFGSYLLVHLLLFALFVWSLWHFIRLVERNSDATTAWVAAVVYAIAASSDLIEGTDPNLEQLTLPFVVGTLDLADSFRVSGRVREAAFSGVLLAATVLVKPVLGLILPIAAVLLLMNTATRWRGFVAWTLAGVVTTAIILVPFAAAGLWSDMVRGAVDYNRTYVDAGLGSITGWRAHVELLLKSPADFFFFGALGLGALTGLRPPLRRFGLLGLAWWFAAWAGVKLGVRDWYHYFISLVPPSAVLFGVATHAVRTQLMGSRASETARFDRSTVALAGLAVVPIAATFWLVPVRTDLAVRADDPLGSRAAPHLLQQKKAAAILDRITKPDERIYVVTDVASNGSGQAIYWLAHRKPASRWIFPIVMFPPRQPDVARDLATRPPAAVVLMPNASGDYAMEGIRRGRLKEVARLPVNNSNGIVIYGRRAPR